MGRREEVECWLTDMDGVLVHENHALPGAAELLRQWEDTGTPYLVLTNNSIFTARDLSARLRASGLNVPEDRIWTSALATADFLKQQLPGGTAFVIGEAGILTALHEAGFVMTETDPDFVVVGETRNYSFEAITKAIRLIGAGSRFIATNPASCSAVRMPASPMTNAVPPGSCCFRKSAVARALVQMRSSGTCSPEARRRAARSRGVKIELFVSTR